MESSKVDRAAYWLTLAVAVAPLVSIAATNILFVAALIATLVAYRRLEMPPKLSLPLAIFFGLTVLAVAVAGEWRVSFPKLKQLIVFATLPLIFTVFRGDPRAVKRLITGWAVVATASGLWSFVQFLQKRQYAIEQGVDFYPFYVGQRATGFMSHWMTFGAEQMIVMLVLTAALLSGMFRRGGALLCACVAVIGASIALSFVRSVWIATAMATIYLIATWRPKLLLLLPVIAPLAWFVSPRSVRERAMSVYRPHGTVDSNEHRSITLRTGMEMIKAHPLMGIGPDVVARDFQSYVPADIPRPLPEGAYGHLHNLYLQLAAERGVPALMAFLWFIATAAVYIGRSAFGSGSAGESACPAAQHSRNQNGAGSRLARAQASTRVSRRQTKVRATIPSQAAVARGAIAVIIAALAGGFFEVNLGDSEVLRMFLASIACAYAVMYPEPVDA